MIRQVRALCLFLRVLGMPLAVLRALFEAHDTVTFLEGFPGSFDNRWTNLRNKVQHLHSAVSELGLPMTAKAAYRLLIAVKSTPNEAAVTGLARDVASRFRDEVEPVCVLSIPNEHLEYYDPLSDPVGDLIGDSIPGVSRDWKEAGKCRAVGLWTACVFHLMRAVDTVLQELTTDIGVEWNEKLSIDHANWGTLLKSLTDRVDEIAKGSKTDEKVAFVSAYSDLLLDLRAFQKAWRDGVSHGRFTCDEQLGVRIYGHVAEFMRRAAQAPNPPAA